MRAENARLREASQAARDVLAERRRQVAVEGWTPEHDDEHIGGSLANAAACYAHHAGIASSRIAYGGASAAAIEAIFARRPPPVNWPWIKSCWKPTGRRRDLVKAGALIIAEIERLDRAAIAKGGERNE